MCVYMYVYISMLQHTYICIYIYVCAHMNIDRYMCFSDLNAEIK